nr:unnamed protein product [Spirometra erinaceieuropaei]
MDYSRDVTISVERITPDDDSSGLQPVQLTDPGKRSEEHVLRAANTDTNCQEAEPRGHALALRVAKQLAEIAEELEAQYGHELQERIPHTPDIWTNFAFLRSTAVRPMSPSKRSLCGIGISCLALLLTSWCLMKRFR